MLKSRIFVVLGSVLAISLIDMMFSGAGAQADSYSIGSAACTSTGGSTCVACIASVEKNVGGSYSCYVNTCTGTVNFSTCVQTTGTSICCQTTVSSNPCSSCRYWYCADVGGGNLCNAPASKCTCSISGGTKWPPTWYVFNCTGGDCPG
jgi:hypothetical protein